VNDHTDFDMAGGDDPVDQRLADLLGRVGGSATSTEQAFARVTAKVRRVRQVRTTIGAAAVVGLIGVGSVLVVREGPTNRPNGGIPLSEGAAPIESTPAKGDDPVTTDSDSSSGASSSDSSTPTGNGSEGDTGAGSGSGGSGSAGTGTGTGTGSAGTGTGSAGTGTGSAGAGTGTGSGSGGTPIATSPSGNIGAVGEEGGAPTTTTAKAPVSPTTAVAVPTTKAPTPVVTTPGNTTPAVPTTKAPAPNPPTTRPSPPASTPTPSSVVPSRPVTPSVPASIPVSIPVPSTAPVPVTPAPSVPVTPALVRACTQGTLAVDLVNGDFVVATARATPSAGFIGKVTSARKNTIVAEFTSLDARIVATLRLQTTGNGVRHDCEIQVGRDSDDDSNDDDSNDDDSGDDDSNDDSGEVPNGKKK